MRTLSSTLLAEQKKESIDPLVKVTIYQPGGSSYTYEEDSILELEQEEDGEDSQIVNVYLDNSDGALDGKDFEGWYARCYFGMVTGAGNEYSEIADLHVIAQKEDHWPDNVVYILSLAGEPNLINEDLAVRNWAPERDDPRTVKDFLNRIFDISLKPFLNIGTSYFPVYDSEDGIIDTFRPGDFFRVNRGDRRWEKVKELLSYTGCVIRFQHDDVLHSQPHIFVPTTSGTNYDYEYELGADKHEFFAKSLRKRLVIPNKIIVQSHEDDDDQYYGFAYSYPSWDLHHVLKVLEYRLSSDAQATAIAEAMIARLEREAEVGHAIVPIMNVGAEVFDYVKITDSVTGDSVVGNIGWLRRHWKANSNTFDFQFRLGKIGLLGLAGTNPPKIEDADIWSILSNILNTLQIWQEQGIIFESTMIKHGDILYRDADRANRLAPDAGDGTYFLRSRGVGLSPEWASIEELIDYKTGALNRMLFRWFNVPVPSFSVQVSEDHSGGGFTSNHNFSIPVPSFDLSQMAIIYERYESGDDDDFSIYGDYWEAQTFTPANAHTINILELPCYYVGSPATIGNVTIGIRATSGGLPTGGDLTSVTLPASDLPSASAWLEKLITGHSLIASTKYAKVIRVSGGDSSNYMIWRGDASAPSYNGGARCHSDNGGSSWSEDANTDMLFREGEVQ